MIWGLVQNLEALYYFLSLRAGVVRSVVVVVYTSFLQMARNPLAEFHCCHTDVLVRTSFTLAFVTVDNIGPLEVICGRRRVIFH